MWSFGPLETPREEALLRRSRYVAIIGFGLPKTSNKLQFLSNISSIAMSVDPLGCSKMPLTHVKGVL